PGLRPLSLHDALPIYDLLPIEVIVRDSETGLPKPDDDGGYRRRAPFQRVTLEYPPEAQGMDATARRRAGFTKNFRVFHPSAAALDRKSTRLNSSHVKI